jgi:hypothetical protein
MFNKLTGIPSIYYLNLDSELDRRRYMEKQFEKWNLNNVTRFSGSKYLAKNYDNWSNVLHFPHKIPERHRLPASITLSTLESIKYWLETTSENHLILMEDDYDLSLIEYWHFDWEYLMNNIPYDWDCIQLGYESNNYIRFFLCPKLNDSFWGPVLINRHFAQKLINLHYVNEKYILIRKYGQHPFNTGYRVVSLDSFIPFLGKTYQLPLITQNPHLDKIPKKHHFLCKDIYYDWWQNERDKYSLEDFFSYGKQNDREMTVEVIHND